jgi:hypothetical protein
MKQRMRNGRRQYGQVARPQVTWVAERDGLEPGRFPPRREHDLPSSPSAETGAFVVLDAPLL